MGVKRLIFWEFARASWQYDIVVALILAFIFLTPRDLFRDQPKASSVVMLPSNEGGPAVFWIEPELLTSAAEQDRCAKASVLLKTRMGKKYDLVRLEPIFDAEKDIRGYMAYTKP